MADAPKITREDLARLLQIKIQAQAAFSAASKICREMTNGDISARLEADLVERKTLEISCAADTAYNLALSAFVKQEAE